MSSRTLGRNLKKLRRGYNLTQEALAAKVGTSRIYIAKIEAGERVPSVTMLERLAQVLKVKPSKLID